MSVLEQVDVKVYGKLLANTLPAVIETEEENDRLLAVASKLMAKESLPREEQKLLELLLCLIERYEDRHYPLGEDSTPHSTLLHLMEARDLTHKDVWQLLGSKGVASEVLNGKRAISKQQARRLAEFFHVSADLFI
jgi:HTH-type transcriptional regulator/antitoxin HigA